MHLGPNFWPIGPHRAGPMCVGRLEVKKYESVGHDQRFGTLFANVINLKVPKDAPRAKFLALRAT
jgi:hypothetical protein